MPDAYLSTAEVAAELACSEQTVRNAIRRGDLEAFRYGRLLRVRREVLDAFLAAHSAGDQLARAVPAHPRALARGFHRTA